MGSCLAKKVIADFNHMKTDGMIRDALDKLGCFNTIPGFRMNERDNNSNRSKQKRNEVSRVSRQTQHAIIAEKTITKQISFVLFFFFSFKNYTIVSITNPISV